MATCLGSLAGSSFFSSVSQLWSSCPCTAGLNFSVGQCASNCFNMMTFNLCGKTNEDFDITHIGGAVSHEKPQDAPAPAQAASAPVEPQVPKSYFQNCTDCISSTASNLFSSGGNAGSRCNCTFGSILNNICNLGSCNCCGTSTKKVHEHMEGPNVHAALQNAGGGTGLSTVAGMFRGGDFNDSVAEEPQQSFVNFTPTGGAESRSDAAGQPSQQPEFAEV